MLFLLASIATWLALPSIANLQSASNITTVESANKYIEDHKHEVNQRYRPRYHFAPPLGWINDPNGFIYYKGEYHLFYQFNPYDSVPNKIHWGHAKSKDLVNWEHLPVALAPDQPYDQDGVFSGSAIEKDGKLYVIYTGFTKSVEDGQVQCIAVSEDGVVFKKVPENPVLSAKDLPSTGVPGEFRDPKVFKRNDKYYVVLASKAKENYGQILMYESEDLIKWQYKSTLLQGTTVNGIMWECPDLFNLDGRDVLLLSSMEMRTNVDSYRNYASVIQIVGQVNWTSGEMVVAKDNKELDHGMDFYATQTLLDDAGRRIAISWMNMWHRDFPTHTLNHSWTGSMTIPRELHLINNQSLTQTPAANLSSYFNHSQEYNWIAFEDDEKEFDKVSGTVGMLDLVVFLESSNTVFTVELFKSGLEKTIIRYASKFVTLDRFTSGIVVTGVEDPQVYSRVVQVELSQNKLQLTILIDSSSVEVFINNGTQSMTANVYPTGTSGGITFKAKGRAVVQTLKFYYNSSNIIRVPIILLFIPIVNLFINSIA